LQAAFPGLNSSEEDLISEGDKIVVRRTFSDTHKGEFMGVAASGNEVTFTGIIIDRLTGGKIEEQWINFDTLGLLQQIGAIPAPGEGGGWRLSLSPTGKYGRVPRNCIDRLLRHPGVFGDIVYRTAVLACETHNPA
jgi:hypothetical protein